MKYKEKLLTQTVICLTMVALLRGTAFVNDSKIKDVQNTVERELKKHYTVEKINDEKDTILSKIVNAPDALNTLIMAANEVSYYNYPIDESNQGNVVNIRAAAGGEVIYAGIHKDLGVCIRIKHQDKISTYGNLNTINVITGERVNKSQIIGTYSKTSNKEFYYQLEDNMV